MSYYEIGKKYCEEINQMLEKNQIQASFVTGGGYAYDSIKYKDESKVGDFDFMIVYDKKEDIDKIISLLSSSNFSFENKYLNLDKELLMTDKIDIIRLSGTYDNIKSTINLVPIHLVKRICNFEKEIVIKKIAHNRNTSLFFAYGSNNSRIIVNFISPSFVTEDKEDHYVHLDFSIIEKNNNIYLGILADAILKGFNENYDTIGFQKLRSEFLKNIHDYFKEHNISSKNYIYMFANNMYFSLDVKEKLENEFHSMGMIEEGHEDIKSELPIVFTTNFDNDYEKKPFNFINNKPYKMTLKEYILKMQDNEYDRQYLLDALGKFLGYLMTASVDGKEYNGNILEDVEVYGINDLYLKDFNNYNMLSIVKTIMKQITISNDINNVLKDDYVMICLSFLSQICKKSIYDLAYENDIENSMFNQTLNPVCMDIDVIKNLTSFNEMGTYHNYTSKVMPSYTKKEVDFLSAYIKKEDKVLDIMCGYGRLANTLKMKGYNHIYGIDSEKYGYLGIKKDFVFILDDFLTYDFKRSFDVCYSLYNCYDNVGALNDVLNKAHATLVPSGICVVDFFNKDWRDSIERDFYKELYINDDYKLIIKRDYESKKGTETTHYELLYHDIVLKTFHFSQGFFHLEEVLDLIKEKWEYDISNSDDSKTRTNSQKHILVLRKKI